MVKICLTLAAMFFAGTAIAQSCPQAFKSVAPTGHDKGTANSATWKTGSGAAGQGDFDPFISIVADPCVQHSPDLPDGWKQVRDLTTNRAEGFSSKRIPRIAPGGFMDNGNILVMFRKVDHGDGAHKKFDLMYFDEDGPYAEHRDRAQPVPARMPHDNGIF